MKPKIKLKDLVAKADKNGVDLRGCLLSNEGKYIYRLIGLEHGSVKVFYGAELEYTGSLVGNMFVSHLSMNIDAKPNTQGKNGAITIHCSAH